MGLCKNTTPCIPASLLSPHLLFPDKEMETSQRDRFLHVLGGQVTATSHISSTYLLGAWVPAPISPGRAFLRTLSACSRLLSWAGASTTAETLLAAVFTTAGTLPVGAFATVGTLPSVALTTVGALLMGAFTTVVTLLLVEFTTVDTLLVGAVTTVDTLLAGLLLAGTGAGAGAWAGEGF